VNPGREVGVFDVGERHDGAGEHHCIEPAERIGGGANDAVDGGGVLHVEFERRASDGIGQLGQQVHAPRRDGHLGAALTCADGDSVADSRRRPNYQQTQSVGIGMLTTH
jgi:hypothetical protein